MSLLDKVTAQLPIGKKSQQAEYYFALNIGLSQATAAVWSVMGHTLDVLGQHTVTYKDTDDLVVQANVALDKALGAFDIEPDKILFGVPDGWLLDDNLKEPYLKLLRSMLKEYGLEPLAYVATSHALTHYLQKMEGAPTSAVFIEMGDFIVATVVQGGKVVGNKAIKHTSDLFADVEKLMLSFHGVETLPSRILLYTADRNEDLEKVRNHLMSFPWMQKLSFLHLPKVETLEDNTIPSSLVYAGAAEINPDTNFKIQYATGSPTSRVQALMEDVDDTVSNVVDAARDEVANIGFIAGDILHPDAEAEPVEDEELTFGGEEMGGEGPIVASAPRRQSLSRVPAPVDEVEDYAPSERVPMTVAGGGSMLGGGLGLATRIKDAALGPVLGLFESDGTGSSKKKWVILPLVALVLLFGLYAFLVKVHINILVDPKVLEKDAQVIADPKVTAVDQANNVIPATVIETTVTGTGKISATGQKQIGDKAKGQIIVYNKTSAPKSLSAGTTLSGPGGLKFTLDSGVTVASQSAVEGGISYGKATSSVTASAIGPDSNLAAGTELSVASFGGDAVSAKIDQALAGGTSKNVTVVTADDQKRLQAQVTNDLKQKAASDLQGKLPAGNKLPPDALTVVDSKFTFNKNVNDQASEFSVNATVHYKGTSYADTDLKTILGKLVETNVPEGFELNLQETETQADISKIEKDGRLVFVGRFRAKLMPKFNQSEIKSRIKGKTAFDVAEVLKGYDNVVGSEITFTPALPTGIARMPFLDNNILITVSPK